MLVENPTQSPKIVRDDWFSLLNSVSAHIMLQALCAWVWETLGSCFRFSRLGYWPPRTRQYLWITTTSHWSLTAPSLCFWMIPGGHLHLTGGAAAWASTAWALLQWVLLSLRITELTPESQFHSIAYTDRPVETPSQQTNSNMCLAQKNTSRASQDHTADPHWRLPQVRI